MLATARLPWPGKLKFENGLRLTLSTVLVHSRICSQECDGIQIEFNITYEQSHFQCCCKRFKPVVIAPVVGPGGRT